MILPGTGTSGGLLSTR